MHDDGRQTGPERASQVETAARHVIQPLIRSCLHVGLSPDALRQIVEEALAESQEAPVLPQDRPDPGQRQDLADLARVLSAWHTHPDYVDDDGTPQALTREGAAPSFHALASMANPSLEPEATLERLLLAGAVRMDSNRRVRALRRELLSREWDELGLWSWHQSARRVLETLEFNYTVAGVGRFERAARSERLPARLVPIFNVWVREHGEEFLRMADDWLTQHEVPDVTEGDPGTVATGVGVYLFVDDYEET